MNVRIRCYLLSGLMSFATFALADTGAIYAFVNEKPVYTAEIIDRINELPLADRQRVVTQSGAAQAFVENVLVDKMITEAAAGLNIESTETYARRLRAAGDRILRELYVERLISRVAPPTEAELGAYYRLHLADFTRPATIQLTFVLVGDVATANRIYREVKGGAAFDALRTTWSITTDSVTILQVDNLPPEMHGQLAGLAADGIFLPYVTTRGVYIFKKLSTTPLRIMPLDEVRDAVRQAAHREKVQRFLAAFLETLKNQNPVRVVGSIQLNAPQLIGGQ